MLIYSKTKLLNLLLLKKAKYLNALGLLNASQYKAIKEKYKTNLYSPNLFVRIGLFVFTCFGVVSVFGIFIVMFGFENKMNFFILPCALFSVFCCLMLEFVIKWKNHYKSGVTEALLYLALTFYSYAVSQLAGYLFDSKGAALFYDILLVSALVVAIIRYKNLWLGIVASLYVYHFVYLIFLNFEQTAKIILPFALMFAGVLNYFLSTRLKRKQNLIYWNECFQAIEVSALVIIYLSMNYFIIRESSIKWFGLVLLPGEDIPLNYLFYFSTVLIPFIYITFGLKRKDKILLWVGLILLVATVLTFKHYFDMGHPEITLTAAGAIAIVVAYFSIRVLKVPKYGLSYREEERYSRLEAAEAMIIAQSFTSAAGETLTGSKFGGGNFGGAGSDGDF